MVEEEEKKKYRKTKNVRRTTKRREGRLRVCCWSIVGGCGGGAVEIADGRWCVEVDGMGPEGVKSAVVNGGAQYR